MLCTWNKWQSEDTSGVYHSSMWVTLHKSYHNVINGKQKGHYCKDSFTDMATPWYLWLCLPHHYVIVGIIQKNNCAKYEAYIFKILFNRTYIHTYIFMQAYIYPYISYICTYMHTYMHMHLYIYAYIHSYACIYVTIGSITQLYYCKTYWSIPMLIQWDSFSGDILLILDQLGIFSEWGALLHPRGWHTA